MAHVPMRGTRAESQNRRGENTAPYLSPTQVGPAVPSGPRQWRAAVAVLALLPAALRAEVVVFRPNIGVPAFALTGGVFEAEVLAPASLAAVGWRAALQNDLRVWTCTVTRAVAGVVVDADTRAGYRLSVRAPPDAPPETFRLALGHADAGAVTNRHAVRLLPALDIDFYILHRADPQADTSKAAQPDGGGVHGKGSIQAMLWAAPVFSLVNPRFILGTGDELDDGHVDTAARYAEYLDAVTACDAPVLLTRGNNDAGPLDHWEREIGPPTCFVRIGSFFVALKDRQSTRHEAWFAREFTRASADADIGFRLLAQHYNDSRLSHAFSPPAGQFPDLELVGHNHVFMTLAAAPYPVLSSGSGWHYGNVAFLDFRRRGRRWECPGIAGHGTTNVLRAVGEWGGTPTVSAAFSQPNDGTATANAATVVNRTAFDFYDGRVRFLLAANPRGYLVTGGETLASYTYAGGTRVAVLVRVDLKPDATASVTVAPRSSPAHPPTDNTGR